MSSLAVRNRRAELMDSPDVEPSRFIGSLSGLRRVNFITGSARILWREIAAFAAREQRRPIRILDVACGAGDMVVRLDRLARRAGVDVELAGCDINPLAVEYARELAERAGARAEFFALNALSDPIPDRFDLVVSSLFLHHLDEDDAVAFLRRAAAAAHSGIIIHDLVRSREGYLLAAVGVPLLLCNDVCRKDGPASVEGAFTVDEARALAARAGLEGAQIVPRFPYRFVLRWDKP